MDSCKLMWSPKGKTTNIDKFRQRVNSRYNLTLGKYYSIILCEKTSRVNILGFGVGCIRVFCCLQVTIRTCMSGPWSIMTASGRSFGITQILCTQNLIIRYAYIPISTVSLFKAWNRYNTKCQILYTLPSCVKQDNLYCT